MNLVSAKWTLRGVSVMFEYGTGFASVWTFCRGLGRTLHFYEHFDDFCGESISIMEDVLNRSLEIETTIREAEYEAIESV